MIDEKDLLSKLYKKLEISSQNEVDRYLEESVNTLTLEMQIYASEWLNEDSQQRLIKVGGMLEVILTSQNRLLIKYGVLEERKKAHLKVNGWSKLAITFDRAKNRLIVTVDKHLVAEIPLTIIPFFDILRSQITLGGHTSFPNQDQLKSKHLFYGLMKAISFNLSQSSKFEAEEETKKAAIESDEFHFIHSLYELAKFDPERSMLQRSTVPLAQRPQRERKILICHDIPSGLCEEKASVYGGQGANTCPQQNWYRFNHWAYIDIFVYFGHYTVTIPPPAYTDIAHTHGVKMLGTLIFEWEAGAKEAKLMLEGKVFMKGSDLGNRFYAQKLAQIAHFYGFDGYLMNFECQIDDVDGLLLWLSVLKEELHLAVPGSLLIWYDSVLHDGSLRWQSALNDKNYRFFQATDGFFTDYHWQLDNLQVTLDAYNSFMRESNPELSTYDIYYGNDCYGRGTYGGGRLDIYKALNEIKKYPFSISLFGQALWYEQYEGLKDPQIFSINEDLFWKGRNLMLMADSTGKKVNQSKEQMMLDWQMEEGDGKWKVIQHTSKKGDVSFSTISCYQMCTKKLCIQPQSSDIVSMTFMCTVKGTGPDFQDAYRVYFELEDADGNNLLTAKTKDLCVCNKDGSATPILIQVHFTESQKVEILPKLANIILVEQGRDAEYWAGHFGAEFSNERFYIEHSQIDSDERNLHTHFKDHGLSFDSICTFFNKGHGNSYFIDGVEVLKGNWSNMTEYDASILTPISYPSNISVSISSDAPAYVGSSSLMIRGIFTDNKTITISLIDVVTTTLSLYDIKIVYRQKQSHALCFVMEYQDETEECIDIKDAVVQNGWSVFTAKNLQLKTIPLKSIALKITAGVIPENNIEIQLGMISITPHQQLISKFSNGKVTVIDSVRAIITGQPPRKDVTLSWNYDQILHTKYFRLYRNEQFIGVTRQQGYIDRYVNQDSLYRIDAISLDNEVSDSLIITC